MAVAQNEVCDAIGFGLGDEPALEAEPRCSDAAPPYGLAVQELLVAGCCFDGVAQSMAVVQNHPQSGLTLVAGDYVSLYLDACRYNVCQCLWVSSQNRVSVALEVLEELGIANDSRLDGFLQPGAQLRIWKRAQQIGVGQHREGMVEASD